MSLKELVFAQAQLLTGPLGDGQRELLKLLCAAAVQSLEGRLKAGLTAEDCEADFIAAAALYALSALNEAGGSVEEWKAGDLTIKQGSGDAASRCLRRQAELMIAPYLENTVAFMGV